MDFTDRINTLPDSVRRQILQAVCDTPPTLAQSRSAKNKNDPSSRDTCEDSSPQHCQKGSSGVELVAGACILDEFLSAADVNEALDSAKQALAEDQRQAAIGGALPLSADARTIDTKARGDTMRWLHPEREAAAGRAPLVALLGRMEALRQQLARQGYDVSGRPTFQLACYPGGGARYVRHADASLSCPTRTLTAIVYLNDPDWDVQVDGGCLALYNVPYSGPLAGRGVDAGEPATVVAPLGGRLVVFEAHLFHEVLPAHRHRYAVTAWFHRRAPGGAKASDPGPARPQPQPALAPSLQPAAPGTLAQPQPQATMKAQLPASQLLSQPASAPAVAPSKPAPAPVGATVSPSLSGTAETPAAGPGEAGAGTAASAGQAAGSHPQRSLPEGGTQQPTQTSVEGAQGRIFVSIAAYRDPECQWTLHSLFSRADRPERVRVGVVWQVHPTEDAAFVRVAGARAHPEWLQQVRQVVLPHTEATGPCKARALAQGLWDGEEYVLQIDSHMRMVPGWDTKCIEQLAAAEALSATGKVVLSSYPLGYSGDGAAASVPDEATAPVTLLCARGFGEDGFLRTTGRVLRERPSAPLPSSFWAAGLSFSRSRWIQEVPYCRDLPHLFFGEESYMLARMWTRGWDVFAPAVPLAFHQWERAAREHTYQRDNAPGSTTSSSSSSGNNNDDGPGFIAHAGSAPGSTLAAATSASADAVEAGDSKTGAGGVGALCPRVDGQGAQYRRLEDPVAAPGQVREASPGWSPAALRRRSQRRVLAVLGVYGNAEDCGGVGRPADGGAAAPGVGPNCSPSEGSVRGGGLEDGWGPGQLWGLGTDRTLEDMAAVTGVHYASRRASSPALWGGLNEAAFV